MLRVLREAILTVYFPPFLVKGLVGPVFGFFWLYPIFGTVLLVRRWWVPATVVILLPLAGSWLFSWLVLGD